jgi:Ala-tRNA(Pro) deacylase
VDLGAVRRVVDAKAVSLASEEHVKDQFIESETGARLPCGNPHALKVFADYCLEEDEEIAFNAGTHRELIRMAWKDCTSLVESRMFPFAAGRSAEAAQTVGFAD